MKMCPCCRFSKQHVVFWVFFFFFVVVSFFFFSEEIPEHFGRKFSREMSKRYQNILVVWLKTKTHPVLEVWHIYGSD